LPHDETTHDQSCQTIRITYIASAALVPRTMLGLYPVSFVMKLPPRCLPALNLLLGFTGLLSFGHRRVFARLPTSPAGSSR
jgi:ABC-type branched-subunit amino acid transport system permease subunit